MTFKVYAGLALWLPSTGSISPSVKIYSGCVDPRTRLRCCGETLSSSTFGPSSVCYQTISTFRQTDGCWDADAAVQLRNTCPWWSFGFSFFSGKPSLLSCLENILMVLLLIQSVWTSFRDICGFCSNWRKPTVLSMKKVTNRRRATAGTGELT